MTQEPYQIKFGTDGWRAVIANRFTVDNVQRLTAGVIAYMKEEHLPLRISLGHDCRFASDLFSNAVKEVCRHEGVDVLYADTFITTPMLSLITRDERCGLGIMLTASHNPPSYHGFKVKGAHGGPLDPDSLRKIETLIPDAYQPEPPYGEGKLDKFDFEAAYRKQIEQSFDLEKLNQLEINVAYDAMYGSGQVVFPNLLPSLRKFRCNYDPTFQGISPEPIERNLTAYAEFVSKTGDIDLALATDGDADRIGALDGKGDVLDSHHIMLLLLHYLVKYRQQTGVVVSGVSTTTKLKKYCDQNGLDYIEVPIGFKHISKHIEERDDVLLGGEESGGITVAGHIPERDGIYNGLLLIQLLAETGKTIEELKQEIYKETGSFGYSRMDWHVDPTQKTRILEACAKGIFDGKILDRKVTERQFMDGFKYYLSEDEWVMIRPSGTEPVLRLYAESTTNEGAAELLEQLKGTLVGY